MYIEKKNTKKHFTFEATDIVGKKVPIIWNYRRVISNLSQTRPREGGPAASK